MASGLSLAFFLLLLTVTNGWTDFGTKVFMGAVIVTAIIDFPGNPIYNAPFEKLFLEEGEFLSAHAIVEHPSQAETAVSGNNVIVDADGNLIRDVSDFLTLLYRLVLYSVIYGTLTTVRGFLPKAADGETETKKKKTKTKTKKPA